MNGLNRGSRLCVFFFVVAIAGLFSSSAWASPWQGKVTRVLEGDLLEVQRGRDLVEVRLFGIGMPNSRQLGGRGAVDFSKRLLQGKRVVVVPEGSSRGRRVTAMVYRGNMLVNRELVRRGQAWVDSCHRQSYCREWQRLEQSARSQRIGYWKKYGNSHRPQDWQKNNDRDRDRRPGSPPSSHRPQDWQRDNDRDRDRRPGSPPSSHRPQDWQRDNDRDRDRRPGSPPSSHRPQDWQRDNDRDRDRRPGSPPSTHRDPSWRQ